MRETKYWTWHMTAGVVILLLLGLHMCIMHLGSITHLFVAKPAEAVTSEANSMARDGSLFFAVTYILLLGAAIYHGLYGLRTILFELTLKPGVEKAVTFVLLVLGLGLFSLGTWAALTSHANAVAPSDRAAIPQSGTSRSSGSREGAVPARPIHAQAAAVAQGGR